MSKEMILIVIGIAVAVLLCFLLAIANYSGDRFLEKYKEYDSMPMDTNMSIKSYVQHLNFKYFSGNLQVVQIPNLAGDAYTRKTLYLSSNTLSKDSVASFTIVSHELGHAMQDKEGSKLKRLFRLKLFLRIISVFMMPCLLAGIILLFFGEQYLLYGAMLLALAGFIFLLSLFMKLVTISIEKDASKRALVFLREIAGEKQVKICKKFLNDARLTYWGDFLRLFFGWTFLSRKTSLFS